MPDGFVGVSMEFRAVHQYTGRDPAQLDPVLVPLLQGLAPDQSRVLRIGGNSTDDTWWPVPGMIPPSGLTYALTPDWLATTRALAEADDAKLLLGVNLVAGRPAIAAAEGRAFLNGIGAANIDALEIGNEPNLYSANPWYRDRRGNVYRRRPKGYTLAAYEKQFSQWSEVLPPQLGLAGPVASNPNWLTGTGLRSFIAAEPRLALVTYHRYPLRGCTTDPTDPTFPSIDNLLEDSSSAGLAAAMAPLVSTATRAGVPFRVAEMNSASCEGAAGVSDTFASALWALDTMFNFAADGVQGVNFHMLPGSHYELFTVSHTRDGEWQAFVRPEYYGLALFAQAFPPGAQLLPVTAPVGPTKVWATRATDGSVRVTAINQDPDNEHDVQVTIPGATATGTVETLTAPSLNSPPTGVELGGQDLRRRDDGPGRCSAVPATTTPVTPAGDVYTVALARGQRGAADPAGDRGGDHGDERHHARDRDHDHHHRPGRRVRAASDPLTVQLAPHLTRELARHPRHRLQLLPRRREDRVRRAEVGQQRPFAGRADPGELVKHRGGHRPVAADAVVGDGEAMGLVTDALQQLQLRCVMGEHQRLRAAGEEHLLDPLGQRDDRSRRGSRNGSSTRMPAASWPLPPSITITFGSVAKLGS